MECPNWELPHNPYASDKHDQRLYCTCTLICSNALSANAYYKSNRRFTKANRPNLSTLLCIVDRRSVGTLRGTIAIRIIVSDSGG